MTGPVQKPDETIPGGRYLNATQDRWIDCWGADLGPVACTDCDCPDGECAANITITVNEDGTFEADPPELVESVEIVDESGSVVGEAKPKRTRKGRLMSMSRAQLAAELWGRLGTQFTEAGIANTDTTGNLKEPVDSTLLALGVSYGDLATGTVADADIPRAIALASYFGYVKLIHAVAHTGTSRTISVGAPSVSKSENRADYIRSLERLRDAAKAEADDLSPGRGTWAFGDLSLGIYPSEAQ